MWEGVVAGKKISFLKSQKIMTQITQATSKCTARCSVTSFIHPEYALSIYNYAILRIQLVMYFVNILGWLTCYATYKMLPTLVQSGFSLSESS